MTFVEFAAKWFGRIAHTYIGQRRKYSGVWYFRHTEAVHDTVMRFGGSRYQGAASYLHDYREDVVTYLKAHGKWIALWVFETIYKILFPLVVRELVIELTDVYTSENYPVKQNPLWNRKWRKAQEAHRISKISDAAKEIKLADLYDNTSSIVNEDADFAITYLKEKHYVMKFLHGEHVNRNLYHVVHAQMQKNIDLLKVNV